MFIYFAALFGLLTISFFVFYDPPSGYNCGVGNSLTPLFICLAATLIFTLLAIFGGH